MSIFKGFLQKIGWGEIRFKLQSTFLPKSITPGELRHRLANKIFHLEQIREKKPGVQVDEQLIRLREQIKTLQDKEPEADLRLIRDKLAEEKKEWEARDLSGERGGYKKFAAEERRNRGERI